MLFLPDIGSAMCSCMCLMVQRVRRSGWRWIFETILTALTHLCLFFSFNDVFKNFCSYLGHLQLSPAIAGLLQNLNQNKRTLLPKFYGLYCMQTGGKNIRLVVMNNLLPSAVKMHQKFDLKGSTFKRRASPKEREKNVPTFKDLDFIQDMTAGLLLESDKYSAVCKTIQRDCLVRCSSKTQKHETFK